MNEEISESVQDSFRQQVSLKQSAGQSVSISLADSHLVNQ